MISELEPASAEQEIARIVREELLLGSDRPIPFDQPLGELGVGLDSLGLVNLLTAVENEFGVELSDEIWAERGPLSINELAEIVRSTAASAAPIRPVDRESPVLHGRLERIEEKLSHRGAAGRAAWSATRAVVPVKRFMWTRTRHLVLERSLEDPAPATPAPLTQIELRTLAPGEKPDLSELWTPVHARRMARRFEQAVDDGAVPLVACEEGRVIALDFISDHGFLDVEIDRSGACFGFLLTEARAARGRGIGLALAAYSFVVARELGFSTQLTHVWDGNTAMRVAATQLLGFTIVGSARRTQLAGIARWTWDVAGTKGSGRRLVL
jgi:acyl carrier protein/GNAT superfamily N-acetyltransferase